MKKIICMVIAVLFLCSPMTTYAVEQEKHPEIEVKAPSYLLMEASTGSVICENNADEKRPPASVTKIMTLLLIFEQINQGKMSFSDSVVVSAHAASMGGSQVFLEEGETQTVETLIKCIAVSSANDASVAMAEHIAGSEEAFVAKMNEKAKELKMENTSFVNCCGLDAEGHMTTSRDIALMSRELTVKYPEIFNYTTIWMDQFVHKTKKGESVFGLSSTNKMLRTYPGCNGLKTGSTSKAKFCLSATATRNNISLIAVAMGCGSSKERNADVAKLLDYGFANVHLYEDKNPLGELKEAAVEEGEKETVKLAETEKFTYVITGKNDEQRLEKEIHMMDPLKAPLKKGEVIGEIEYSLNGNGIGTVQICAGEDIKKMGFPFAFSMVGKRYLGLEVK